MKKIEIILQIEKEKFVITKIEPVSSKNLLLIKAKNRGKNNGC